MVTKITVGLLISVAVTVTLQRQFSHLIVFCDVGQGSATLIKIRSTQILIDTGPGRAVLACLGKHMPLFDNTIEYVVISHPQKDHDGGLIPITAQYHIAHLISHIPYRLSMRTHQIHDDALTLSLKDVHIYLQKASNFINSLNESAYVATIRWKDVVVFLSSDISGSQLRKLIPRDVTIVGVAHHGSKTGLYENSLQQTSPVLAVISVGKNNIYGHPHRNVITYLHKMKIKIWRTDQNGELVIDLRKKNTPDLLKNIDSFKTNPAFAY